MVGQDKGGNGGPRTGRCPRCGRKVGIFKYHWNNHTTEENGSAQCEKSGKEI